MSLESNDALLDHQKKSKLYNVTRNNLVILIFCTFLLVHSPLLVLELVRRLGPHVTKI